MKPVQILLLVVAGALGGAVITRVWQKPKAPAAVAPGSAQVREAPAESLPQYVAPPPATEAPAAAIDAPKASPPTVDDRKPSPVAPPVSSHREATKPQRPARTPVAKIPPPPANPRPVPLTARVEPPAPAPAAAPAPAPVHETPAPAESLPPARPEPEHQTPPPPPPRPAPNQVTLNTGVLIPVRLVDGLNSERNLAGDTFNATLDKELVVNGFVIAERGARVDGRVSNVERAGKVRGTATMAIELTRLHTSDGQTVPIQTDAFARQAEPSHQADAAKVGGAAAVGAIIGAIAGGGKGAAIGAGVGGGAGAGDVLLTRGKPVGFPSETRISFRLRTPVTITERR
jgi:hypothetical protein